VKRFLRAAAAILLAACALAAAPAPAAPGEAATQAYFLSIRNQPPLLLAFLAAMPKGGDLHNHLSGAIYAESYLRWAADDGLCLATATMSIVGGTCDASAARPPASAVFQNSVLFNQAIDAMSMRHWNASLNGHDHFFATFGKMGPVSARTGDMLAEVAARAAAEHVSYLELMLTPTGSKTASLAAAETLACPGDPHASCDPAFEALQGRLVKAGYLTTVQDEARDLITRSEAREATVLGCAASARPPGCDLAIRYIAQVSRAAALPRVFAQILAGFEEASNVRHIVSLNLVQPEDDPNAIRDFDRQMEMLAFLRRQPAYASVPITLHAGELTDGLVPPESLHSHIRDSVETGGARRIGHGVDVTREHDPIGLLREMASKKVLVEIALTSNDVILGVKGRRHPLRTYLKYGVPVALVTDDAGVSRSSMTLEYLKAVEDQGLDYRALKRMAQTSLEYSFADVPTKAGLRADLDAAFAAFERARDR
jgi:adenosine deaminase